MTDRISFSDPYVIIRLYKNTEEIDSVQTKTIKKVKDFQMF